MTNTLAKTVALITGASSGIGAATASALAREGAAVAVLARRRDRLEELKDSIESAGPNDAIVESAGRVHAWLVRQVDRLGAWPLVAALIVLAVPCAALGLRHDRSRPRRRPPRDHGCTAERARPTA